MEKSYAELVEDARANVKQVTADEVMAAGDDIVLVDCREPNEWNLAHIPGAILIPRGEIQSQAEGLIPRDKKVIIYCASGNRSALAAVALGEMGYQDVASMAGGIRAWADAGGSIE